MEFLMLLLFFTSFCLLSSADQSPINEQPNFKSDDWSFNFSSPAPHYFSSVHGLLQQWPNTFFPNGHVITMASIPPFTKLYHGRNDADSPPSPEWLAFDVEMSYGITGSRSDSHLLTYQTTRTVPILYFDGQSASLFGSGQLDTQMLHIYGNTTGPPDNRDGFRGLEDEYARANGLCDWLHDKNLGGQGWGIEGVVRMNAGFELIWCDFSSPSLRLMSHLNVTVPALGLTDDLPAVVSTHGLSNTLGKDEDEGISAYPLPVTPTRSDRSTAPTDPPKPPNWRGNEGHQPFLRSQGWEWFTSATYHYGSSGISEGVGEERVKLDCCSILNYYDVQYSSQSLVRAEREQRRLNLTNEGLWLGVKSIDRKAALSQLMRRRRKHTLSAISTTDASIMRRSTERVARAFLERNTTPCTGMDWTAVANEIVQRHAGHLHRLRGLLSIDSCLDTTNYTILRSWIEKLRVQTHALLMPYVESSQYAAKSKSWTTESSHITATFARCKYHHTRLLVPSEGVVLGPEEDVLRSTIEEIMHNICDVTTTIGFRVESLWMSRFNQYESLPAGSRWRWTSSDKYEAEGWLHGVEELMSWLGWVDSWTRCEEACAWDELCFIPMWPLGGFWQQPGRRPGRAPGRKSGDRPSTIDDDLMRGMRQETTTTNLYDDVNRPPSNQPHSFAPGPTPGYGYGYPGGPRPSPEFGEMDETDLWEPKCVKSEYILGG